MWGPAITVLAAEIQGAAVPPQYSQRFVQIDVHGFSFRIRPTRFAAVANAIFGVVPPKLENAGILLLTVCYAQDAASPEYLFDLRPIRHVDLSHFPSSPTRHTQAIRSVTSTEFRGSVRVKGVLSKPEENGHPHTTS